MELLTEYVDSVQTDTNVTIETENINLLVVNVTSDQRKMDSFFYEPSVRGKEENSDVSLMFYSYFQDQSTNLRFPETLSVRRDILVEDWKSLF